MRSLLRDPKLWCAAALLFAALVGRSALPPKEFPTGAIVSIREGAGLQEIAHDLEDARLVRSTFWFRTFAIVFGGERGMKAGEYFFEEPVSAPVLAWRIFRGDHRIETVKITIPEGFTNAKIAALFDGRFPFFDGRLFNLEAPQGYLFPDTYFVPVTATASSTVKVMHENFIRKIFSVTSEIEKSGKTLEDIIRMASLIEGEANNQTDRELVSAVLWKRLAIGMPLQVDVDKKTYEFQGLPKVPINNPGLLAIKAALAPTSTPYLYYLTGQDGKMHYAKTFEEHKQNIAKYLAK